MHEPIKAMKKEAADAGTYRYCDNEYPRMQILTVREMLDDKRAFNTPTKVGSRISTGQGALPL